ncbi:MAG: hypothetical protein RIS47_1295 [Bacteroidota bacterium]|jgi:phage gp46-like protein
MMLTQKKQRVGNFLHLQTTVQQQNFQKKRFERCFADQTAALGNKLKLLRRLKNLHQI